MVVKGEDQIFELPKRMEWRGQASDLHSNKINGRFDKHKNAAGTAMFFEDEIFELLKDQKVANVEDDGNCPG